MQTTAHSPHHTTEKRPAWLPRTRRRITAHIRQNHMLRHSAILFAGYFIAHLLNTFFQMVVSRTLAPAEYTLLAAFLGVLLIIQYPLMTLTNGVSRFSSLMALQHRQGDIRRLLTRWLLRSAFGGLLLTGATLLFRNQLAVMLHVARTGPVVVTAISLPAILMLPIALGVSQGIQRFGWNAATTMAGSVGRLILGSVFVLMLYPTSGWGLLAHGAGVWINVCALAAGLYWILRKTSSSGAKLPQLRMFLLQSGIVQVAYAILMTADVILIKHFIPHEQEFAYAATLGRLAVFLSSTIVIAMFPKVTSEGPISRHQFTIFKQALLYTACCAAAAIAGCLLFPRLLLRILFGIQDPSRALQLMTIAMAAVMGSSAILNMCLQFLVAQKRFFPTIYVIVAAAGYITVSTFWHAHAWNILVLAALANTLPLLVLLPVCWRTSLQPEPPHGQLA